MKNLLTNKCKCGRQMTFNDITSGLTDVKEVVKEKGFYGNNVKYFADGKCTCGKEYVLYLKAASKCFAVIDMAEKEKKKKDGDK